MKADTSSMRSWFGTLAIVGAFLVLLIILGTSWQRLSETALACPDWPGCYGKMLPPSAEMARESAAENGPENLIRHNGTWIVMIVRYLTAILTILVTANLIIGWKNRQDLEQPLVMPLVSLLLCIALIVFNRWSVASMLHPLITLAYMLIAVTLLSLQAWLALHAQERGAIFSNHPSQIDLRPWIIGALLITVSGIISGFWVSSNYAALHCPDFPTCQGEVMPQMDIAGALSIAPFDTTNHEGGNLSNEQGIAVQLIHHITALVILIYISVLGLLAWKKISGECRAAALSASGIALISFALGVASILTTLSPVIVLLHTATAIAMLYTVLRLFHLVSLQKISIFRR